MKAYKLRFYPTLAQRRQLEKEFNACRFVWNWALDTRTKAYREAGETLYAVALSRKLTLLKTSQPFLKAASATALTYVLKSQDGAFKKFFKKQSRYPRFKKRGKVNSCTFQLDKRCGDKVFIPNERLRLPKLGDIRVVWSYQEIPVFLHSATVSRNATGQWFVSLQCGCTDVISPPETSKTIGLDLGISTLIATSDGKKEKPRGFLKNALRRLKFAQRRLAKARKGGKNRRKQKSRVARIHQGIANKRANFLHGLSTVIVRENQAIAIEDLNVRGVMANGKLARSVGDCGWYELRRQLTYKAKWYGRQLNVVPRFQRTTGVCPECGTVGERLPLSARAWTCEHCGCEHDRDIAAARVIDLIGNTVRSTGIDACGLAHKPEALNIC